MEPNHYVQLYPLERYMLPSNFDYNTETQKHEEIKKIKNSLSLFSTTESAYNTENRPQKKFTILSEIKHFSASHVLYMSHNIAHHIAHIIYDCVFQRKLLGSGIISRKISQLSMKVIYHITQKNTYVFLIGNKKTQPYASGTYKIGRRVLLCSRDNGTWRTREIWLLNSIKGKNEFLNSRDHEHTLCTKQSLQGIFPEVILDCQEDKKPLKRYCFYERYVDLYYLSECKNIPKNYFSICQQLAQHFTRLHNEKYIIRDIKLNNTLVDTEGKSVRLCDLDWISQSPSPFLCQGTQAYTAPECFNDNNTLEIWQSADVFSFGCLIYELATNRDVPWYSSQTKSMNQIWNYEEIYGACAKKAQLYFSTVEAQNDFEQKNPIFLKYLAFAAMHPHVKKRYTMPRILELLTTGK